MPSRFLRTSLGISCCPRRTERWWQSVFSAGTNRVDIPSSWCDRAVFPPRAEKFHVNSIASAVTTNFPSNENVKFSARRRKLHDRYPVLWNSSSFEDCDSSASTFRRIGFHSSHPYSLVGAVFASRPQNSENAREKDGFALRTGRPETASNESHDLTVDC